MITTFGRCCLWFVQIHAAQKDRGEGERMSSLAVDLAEHNVLCANDCHSISKHVTLAHHVQPSLQIASARDKQT